MGKKHISSTKTHPWSSKKKHEKNPNKFPTYYHNLCFPVSAGTPNFNYLFPTTRDSANFNCCTCRRCTASNAAWRFSSAEATAAEVGLEAPPPRRWPVEPVPQSFWRRSNKWPQKAQGPWVLWWIFMSSFLGWLGERLKQREQTFQIEGIFWCFASFPFDCQAKTPIGKLPFKHPQPWMALNGHYWEARLWSGHPVYRPRVPQQSSYHSKTSRRPPDNTATIFWGSLEPNGARREISGNCCTNKFGTKRRG